MYILNSKHHVCEPSRKTSRAGVLWQSYTSVAKAPLAKLNYRVGGPPVACWVLVQGGLTNNHPCQGAEHL